MTKLTMGQTAELVQERGIHELIKLNPEEVPNEIFEEYFEARGALANMMMKLLNRSLQAATGVAAHIDGTTTHNATIRISDHNGIRSYGVYSQNPKPVRSWFEVNLQIAMGGGTPNPEHLIGDDGMLKEIR